MPSRGRRPNRRHGPGLPASTTRTGTPRAAASSGAVRDLGAAHDDQLFPRVTQGSHQILDRDSRQRADIAIDADAIGRRRQQWRVAGAAIDRATGRPGSPEPVTTATIAPCRRAGSGAAEQQGRPERSAISRNRCDPSAASHGAGPTTTISPATQVSLTCSPTSPRRTSNCRRTPVASAASTSRLAPARRRRAGRSPGGRVPAYAIDRTTD